MSGENITGANAAMNEARNSCASQRGHRPKRVSVSVGVGVGVMNRRTSAKRRLRATDVKR
ncbi:hypothetical protein CIC12_31105 [Burkholderia sp. SG-MS1]|nr:hypothetical protein [Paraburkholderia sp. SG-MS1]